MIWYCHLLSTVRFHNHLVDSMQTSFGLSFHQFPFITLAFLIRTGKWSYGSGRREWDAFVKQNHCNVSYQLWPNAPWEAGPGVLGRLFRKKSTPGPSEKFNKLTHKDYEGIWIRARWSKHLEETFAGSFPATRFQETRDLLCWPLKDYTKLRLEPWPSCANPDLHRRVEGRCDLLELAPWPSVQDTKASLYCHVAFWKALSRAQSGATDFVNGLSRAEADYANFMSLFRNVSVPASLVNEDTTISPDRSPSKLHVAPPTLEVDLLWRTHRLHPGSYWPWCETHCLRVIDAAPSPSSEYVQSLLRATRDEWEECLPRRKFSVGRNPMDEWLSVYTPETAVAVEPGNIRETSHSMLSGWLAYRRRQYPREDNGPMIVSGSDGGGGGG